MDADGNTVPVAFQAVPDTLDFVRDVPGGPCAQIVYWHATGSMGLHSLPCESSMGFPICQRFV